MLVQESLPQQKQELLHQERDQGRQKPTALRKHNTQLLSAHPSTPMRRHLTAPAAIPASTRDAAKPAHATRVSSPRHRYPLHSVQRPRAPALLYIHEPQQPPCASRATPDSAQSCWFGALDAPKDRNARRRRRWDTRRLAPFAPGASHRHAGQASSRRWHPLYSPRYSTDHTVPDRQQATYLTVLKLFGVDGWNGQTGVRAHPLCAGLSQIPSTTIPRPRRCRYILPLYAVDSAQSREPSNG